MFFLSRRLCSVLTRVIFAVSVCLLLFGFAVDTQAQSALYRVYKQSNGDHLYTVSETERDNAINYFGYVDEGVACYVYETQVTDTVPLYRLFKSSSGDHFYTISEVELDAAITSGYTYEQVEAYVFDTQVTDTVPLYRLYKQSTGKHFYTTSVDEADYAVNYGGYTYEQIECYVFE
jgi:hypothetical protein